MDTKKKKLSLICVIAALLLIIGGVAGTLLLNGFASSDDELSGEIQVSDEETLRQALRSKKDCVITVTENIVVSRELVVNGDKRLLGASIIMNLQRVGSGKSVLAISKGAVLTLDGATVDGNGVVSCVSVKSGGRFESVSGSLIYGYPYGLDVSGVADIVDIKIDEAMHTAINVAIFGDVNLRGGIISNNMYGIAVAEDAHMNIADGVVMTNSYASFVINYGDMDIAGGRYDGAGDNAIENWGTLSIKGTADKPVEICNGTKSALNSKNKSNLTAEHIKIYDMGWHGMCIEKNSTANLKDIYVENAGKSTLYVNSSKANMENVTVVGGAAYAVYGTKNANVTLKNVTIKDTNHRGIMNEDSTLEAEGLKIEGTVQHGIYAKGQAVTKVNNATISKPGVSAVAVAGGEANITNTTIENTTKEGISVGVAGKAKIENVTITNPGNFGIANYGGVVEAATVEISNSGNAAVKANASSTTKANGLVIRNAGKQAISVEDNSVANIENCQIDTTKNAAVYVVNSTMTMKASAINNAGSYAVAVKDCKKADGKKVTLDNIEINHPGEHGVGNINSYVLAGNIVVTGAKRCGIYTEGALSVTNMNQIKVYNAGTCGFGFNGAAEITARNVTITNPKNEGIVVKANANVKKLDNVTITNPGTTGLDNQSGTVNITVDKTYNPDNTAGNGITIVNPGKYGINISKGATVNAAGATVTNAGDRGISSAGTLVLEKDGVTINGTKGHGIYVTADAVIKGTGLTVKSAGDNGIFSEGANLDINGLVLENTKNQGIQLKGGTVKISDFTIQGIGSAAVRPRLDTQLTLANGTIYSYNYGIAADGTSNTTVTNVTVERSGKDGKYTTNALVHLAGSAKLEMTGSTIDGKYAAGTHEHAGRGVELKGEATFIMNRGVIQNNMAENGAGVAMIEGTSAAPVFTMNGGKITGNYAKVNGGGLALSNGIFTLNAGAEVTGNTAGKNGGGISMAGGTEAARPSFILNGGSFTGNTAAAGADMNCTGGAAKIKLGKALTAPIHVKPNVYANTRLMAEKYGDISQADFERSMELLLVDSNNGENWVVLETGYLGRQIVSVTTNGVTTMYLTLEEAVAAANASAGDDVITVLDNVTVAEQLPITGNVTITADKAVTITAAETAKGSMFDISGGTLALIGASEDAKITLAAAKVTTNIIYLNGGNVDLTNVHLAGNAGSTVGEKSGYGIYNNAGKVTAKSVTITDIVKGDGINIRAGATADLDNVKISNTGRYGIKNFGTVNIYNTVHEDHALTVERTKDHAVDIQGSGSMKSFLTNVPENTYPIQIKNVTRMGMIVREGTSIDLSHISIEGTGEECVYFNATDSKASTGSISNFKLSATAKDAVYLAKKSDVTLTNGSITANTYGINVKNANASLTLDGCAIDGKTADVALASGAAIKLQKTLTAEVSVKPSAYTAGVTVVENAGGLSAEDFAASMKLINVVPNAGETWFVDGGGKLAKAVASIGDTLYASLEDAIAAANATEAEDTVTLLTGLTVTTTVEVTENVKIVSGKTVTISSDTTVLKVAAGKTLTVNGTASAKITIASSSKTADAIHNEGTLSLNYVDISGGKNAINATAGTTLSNVTITNAGYRGIHSSGAVVINQNVVINGTGNHGIYLAASASLTGSGLTIQNAGSNGIFSEGAEINISGLTVETTAQQGIQSKGGNVTLSNFTFKETGSAAVRIRGGKVALTNGTVYAYNYGIAADGSSETTVTNVTVERAAKGGAYTANALVNIAGSAKLEIAGTTKIDGKNVAGDGVNVAASKATFTVSGGMFTGTAAGNADVALASGAKITLNMALTSEISVKPGAYAVGTVIATNGSAISDDAFRTSVILLKPVDSNWFVDETGCLDCYHNWQGAVTSAPTCTGAGVKTYTCTNCGGSYTEPVAALGHSPAPVAAVEPSLEADGNIAYWYCAACGTAWEDAEQTKVISLESVVLPKVEAGNVAYMNGTAYKTLKEAVDAANATAEADTITLLCDVTLTAQIKTTSDITIRANKAVTITADMNNTMVNVSSGTLKITGASDKAKITLAAATTTTNIVHNSSNVILTNVHLAGNTGSTVADKKAFGIYNNAGTVTATSVTITDIVKGDGIYVNTGATVNLDNVTITGCGRYGITTKGTVKVTNKIKNAHALSISNTTNHGIEVQSGGSLATDFTGVSSNSYVFSISQSGSMGIIVRANAGITVTNLSVSNTTNQGLYFQGAGTDTISNFSINGTGKTAIYLEASRNVSLTNGTVTTSQICIETVAGSTLTTSKVTVKTTGTGAALDIQGTKKGDEITVETAG